MIIYRTTKCSHINTPCKYYEYPNPEFWTRHTPKLNPEGGHCWGYLLPWPGFDPSFSGHNDRRAIISEWTGLRLRPLCPRCRYLGFSHNAIGPPHLTAFVSFWHFSYLENEPENLCFGLQNVLWHVLNWSAQKKIFNLWPAEIYGHHLVVTLMEFDTSGGHFRRSNCGYLWWGAWLNNCGMSHLVRISIIIVVYFGKGNVKG